MCEYCEDKYKIRYFKIIYENTITKYNYSKNEFERYRDTIQTDAPANFCCNCGRKLGE